MSNIQKFYTLEKFNKNNARELLNIDFGVSAWSANNSPLPKIDKFDLIKTFKGYDTYGMIYRNFAVFYYSKFLNMGIISFSGTEYTSEWIDDLDFRQTNPISITNDNKIFTHIQFYKIYDSLRNDLIQTIKDTINENTILICTGHSLGGAIASICYIDIICNNIVKNRTLYTFGSPRAGNIEFANIINKENTAFRIVNSADLTPTVPLPVLSSNIYCHFNNCISFSINGGNYIYNHGGAYTSFLQE